MVAKSGSMGLEHSSVNSGILAAWNVAICSRFYCGHIPRSWNSTVASWILRKIFSRNWTLVCPTKLLLHNLATDTYSYAFKLFLHEQVERRAYSELSCEEFQERYARTHTPVVITGCVLSMTSRPWTLEYITEVGS